MFLWRILLKSQARPDIPLTCDECFAILDYLGTRLPGEPMLRACGTPCRSSSLAARTAENNTANG
jgi:hypothetical protein